MPSGKCGIPPLGSLVKRIPDTPKTTQGIATALGYPPKKLVRPYCSRPNNYTYWSEGMYK